MSNVLSRQFIAVNCQGNTFFISDIAQLIRDYGFRRFLTEFGFNHGTTSRQKHLSYVKDVVLFSGRVICFPVYKIVMVSDYLYILTDSQGKQYDPDYILSVFEEAFPADAKVMWEMLQRRRHGIDTSGRNGVKRYISHYQSGRRKNISYKRLKRQDTALKEMGTKGVRDLKKHYDCPYDDYSYRSIVKSWKSYRRSQYRRK
jgi:hypothetical protein